jgi:hypothetical protein
MMPVRAATLTGVVLDAAARPAASLELVLQAVGEGLGRGLGGTVRTGTDGRFVFPHLIPGQYDLHARRNVRPNEGAVVPLTLVAGARADVTVQLTRGGRMRGHVVLPEGATLNPSALRINAIPVGETLIFGTGFGGPIASDWSFDWDFLLGPRIIRAMTLPDGWYIKAVLRGDADVTDEPIAFTGAEVVDNLRVLLTREHTVVSGGATDGSGTPVTDFTAIVFAEDASRWTWWSRYVGSARSDQSGRFEVAGLPPGRYLVAAVDRVENNQWRDQAFLEHLRTGAAPLTLDADQKASISLRLIKQ